MSENKKDYIVDVVLSLMFLALTIIYVVLSVYMFCQGRISEAIYLSSVIIVVVVVRCIFVQ